MVTEECEVNHRPLYGQDVAKLHRSHIHEVGTGKKKIIKDRLSKTSKDIIIGIDHF